MVQRSNKGRRVGKGDMEAKLHISVEWWIHFGDLVTIYGLVVAMAFRYTFYFYTFLTTDTYIERFVPFGFKPMFIQWCGCFMRVNVAVMRGMTEKSKEINTKYVSELN